MSTKKVLCKCGCQKPVKKSRVTGKWNKFLLGHNKSRTSIGSDTSKPEKNRKNSDKTRINGKFRKGFSGNPQGKPKGCKSHNTKLLKEILKGSQEKILNKMIDQAMQGNTSCQRELLSRAFPKPKQPDVDLQNISPVSDMSDIPQFITSLLSETMSGNLNAEVLDTISRSVNRLTASFEISDLADRINLLEQKFNEEKC